MNLRRSIFFSESERSSSALLNLSTSSLRERKESSVARRTRAEKSTVCCPSSAVIFSAAAAAADQGIRGARVSEFESIDRSALSIDFARSRFYFRSASNFISDWREREREQRRGTFRSKGTALFYITQRLSAQQRTCWGSF